MLHQMRECRDHALVHGALERDDEVGKVAHRLPAPLDEFGLVAAGRRRDVDLALVAGEAQRVPFLRLAAIFALPGVLGDILRQVVVEPAGNFVELADRRDVGLFLQFAQRGGPRVLALVDAALRHLPHMREVDVLGPLGAPADEHEAGAIEHHDADAGAIGEGFVLGHGGHLVVRREGGAQ